MSRPPNDDLSRFKLKSVWLGMKYGVGFTLKALPDIGFNKHESSAFCKMMEIMLCQLVSHITLKFGNALLLIDAQIYPRIYEPFTK